MCYIGTSNRKRRQHPNTNTSFSVGRRATTTTALLTNQTRMERDGTPRNPRERRTYRSQDDGIEHRHHTQNLRHSIEKTPTSQRKTAAKLSQTRARIAQTSRMEVAPGHQPRKSERIHDTKKSLNNHRHTRTSWQSKLCTSRVKTNLHPTGR